MTNKNNYLTPKTMLVSLLLFGLFFKYYYFLSENLIPSGGPDEDAHYYATKFVYENKRLAVYPQDEELLNYAPSGTTRSFRPPLPYIISAATAVGLDYLALSPKFKFRKGMVLIGAITLVLAFLVVVLYTGYLSLALSTAILLGLMPQFSFLSSYVNADNSAIMACTLITLAVVIMLRRGVTTGSLIFLGFACGILSLTKVTGWFFAVPVIIFGIILALMSPYPSGRAAGLVFLASTITGGWRIVSNILNHGVENFINWRVDRIVANTHMSPEWEPRFGYGAWDKTVVDLLSNFDGFLTKTYNSVVGHLGWMSLEMGLLQYVFYAAVFLGAALYCVCRIVTLPNGRSSILFGNSLVFEFVLVAGILAQISIYLYFNIHYDIQSQGKYILPAIIAPFVLFASGVSLILAKPSTALSMKPKKIGRVGVASLVLILLGVYVHLHGFINYVVPYYDRTAFYQRGDEYYVDITRFANLHSYHDVAQLTKGVGGFGYTATGDDPWILFEIKPESQIPRDIIVRLNIVSSEDGRYQVYWDDGNGLREQNVVEGGYPATGKLAFRRIRSNNIRYLRFDLGKMGDKIVVSKLSFAPTQFRSQLVRLLYHLTFMRTSEV